MPIRLDQIGGEEEQSAPPSAGFSPYPGLQLQGMTLSGRRPTLRFGQDPTQKVVANQKARAANPVPTESERASTRIANAALQKLSGIREQLMISGERGKETLGNRKPLTIFSQTPPSIHNLVSTNPFLAPDAKKLRTQFNSAADLLAMLRTGKQGEKTQVDRVISEYNPGNWDDDATIADRLRMMEEEIRAFAVGELKSPMDRTKRSSQEDDPLGLR